MDTMTEPNTALRAVRLSLRMSQEEMARAIRTAGDRTGEPNDASKRLIQRWEAGEVTAPRPVYIRALELATGQPIENLGFADVQYGLDRGQALGMAPLAGAAVGDRDVASGQLTGIWKSHYEFESSGRDNQVFTSEHYVVLLHRGIDLHVRSLPGTADGRVIMDMTVNGLVVTGTWTERTDREGYYQGSVYHGAIQMLLDPTGHRMSGKWVGYGREFDLNTGPWRLELVTAETGKDAQAKYNKPVE